MVTALVTVNKAVVRWRRLLLGTWTDKTWKQWYRLRD